MITDMFVISGKLIVVVVIHIVVAGLNLTVTGLQKLANNII